MALTEKKPPNMAEYKADDRQVEGLVSRQAGLLEKIRGVSTERIAVQGLDAINSN